MNRSRQFSMAIVFALSILAVSGAAAQDDEEPAATPVAAKPAEDLNAKRKDVAERVLVAQRTLESIQKRSQDKSDTADRLSREVDLLKQIDSLYAQRQAAEESRQEHETTARELAEERAELARSGPPEERPYSFLLLDSLRDKLATAENRLEGLTEAVDAATEELDSAKETNDQAQAERRRLKEIVEHSGKEQEAAKAAIELKAAELEASVAEQSLALRHVELAIGKRSVEIHKMRINLLQETLAIVEKDTKFSESDLKSQLVDINKQESDLKQDVDTAERTLEGLDQQWQTAHKKLNSAARPTPAIVEEEKAAKLARDCQSKRIAAARKQLEFLGPLREAWRTRFALATDNVQRSKLATWTRDTARAAEQLELERRLAEMLVSDSRKELADLEERQESAEDTDKELARWIEREQEIWSELITAQSTHLVKLDSLDNVYQKLTDELRRKSRSQSLWDTLAAGSDVTARVWNTELTEIGDRPVTVGKVVACAGMILLGIFLSRWLTNTVGRRVLGRLGIHGGAAVAFESLSFYVLVLAWTLIALYRMHVPLTIFTFMGGAVAIGVGFGSQKILNNFISGIILLVEQPIRVGDLIEMGSVSGTVDRIGTRSTRIRSGSNAMIVVPNSSFLEENVTNWSLGTATIRSSFCINVAHGSATREVTRILKQAADEHGKVLKKPEPSVSFTDMGPDSLSFEVGFSVDIRNLGDRKRVESDLRTMIEQNLSEAGIELAKPTRGVHLDTARPIEVRMLPLGGDSDHEAERRAA
jgi:potassium-dependent mechanosensitive channel